MRVIDLNLHDLITQKRAHMDEQDFLYIDGILTKKMHHEYYEGFRRPIATRLVCHYDLSLCKKSQEIDVKNVAGYVNYLGVIQAELNRRGVSTSNEYYAYWLKLSTKVMSYIKYSINFESKTGIILGKTIVNVATTSFDEKLHHSSQSWLTDILYYFISNVNSNGLCGVEFYEDGIDFSEIDISKSPEMLALNTILIQISRGNADYGRRLSRIDINDIASKIVSETIQNAKQGIYLDKQLNIKFSFETVTKKIENKNNLVSLQRLSQKMNLEGLDTVGSSTDYTSRYSRWNTPHIISAGSKSYPIDSVMELKKNGQVIFKKVANFKSGYYGAETISIELAETLSKVIELKNNNKLKHSDFSFNVITGRKRAKGLAKRTFAKIIFTNYSDLITELPGGGLGFSEQIHSTDIISIFKTFCGLDKEQEKYYSRHPHSYVFLLDYLNS